MAETDDKKGFTIRDRRFTAQAEELPKTREEKGERDAADSGKREGRFDRPEGPSAVLPEIDFSSFIFSLSTSALLHLGEIPDPMTRERHKDLPLAKQTIDILGMLEEKTKGNLAPDEGKLLETILSDLRLRFVQEAKGR